MTNFIIGIISLTMGIVVMANVFITTVKGTNTANGSICYNSTGGTYACGWGAAEVALWGLLTIAGIAGIVYGTLNVFGIA